MADKVAEAERLVAAHGSIREAARQSGVSYATLHGRVTKAKQATSAPEVSESEIVFPDLPSSEAPVTELIDDACKNFARKRMAQEARRWMEIHIKSNKPIGLSFMGDPHIDSSGCNWPLLREHLRILKETPGMYAIGGQDVTDNWANRLMHLYRDSKMTKKSSWKVVKWLFKDSGVKWLALVMGNHDVWQDGEYLFRANAPTMVPVENWRARFQLVFPNDNRVRIDCAHNFKGQSQWSHLHGAQKEAMLGEQADIYSCHHLHCWAMHQEENALRGFTYWLIRSRGFKYQDEYADLHGFGSQKYGASVTAVINPADRGPGKVQCFAELGQAAEYLTYLRSKA